MHKHASMRNWWTSIEYWSWSLCHCCSSKVTYGRQRLAATVTIGWRALLGSPYTQSICPDLCMYMSDYEPNQLPNCLCSWIWGYTVVVEKSAEEHEKLYCIDNKTNRFTCNWMTWNLHSKEFGNHNSVNQRARKKSKVKRNPRPVEVATRQ